MSGRLIPTRLSLLSRLKNTRDNESWNRFFDSYFQLIYNVAIKTGLNDAEAKDAVQETFIAVSKNIVQRKFDRSKGSFKSWLLQQARWRIAAEYRKRGADRARFNRLASERTGRVELLLDENPSELETLWEKEWQEHLLEAALQRVKRKVDGKHFQMFDLCVWRNWPAARVAKDLNVNLACVYLAKHRICFLLRRELFRLQHGWV